MNHLILHIVYKSGQKMVRRDGYLLDTLWISQDDERFWGDLRLTKAA